MSFVYVNRENGCRGNRVLSMQQVASVLNSTDPVQRKRVESRFSAKLRGEDKKAGTLNELGRDLKIYSNC